MINKTPVLNDGFVGLVDHMGDDRAIVNAARISYNNDDREEIINKERGEEIQESGNGDLPDEECLANRDRKDRTLIRYLMSHRHTTPFEMVEFKFIVRVPMDCWRQWIRHRTASVNEYSTRYTEAIDSMQTTKSDEWRLQATNNKQGSSGFLEDWPEGTTFEEIPYDSHIGHIARIPNGEGVQDVNPNRPPQDYLSHAEHQFHKNAQNLYKERIALGIAKEQARKDLPLSTYTEAYWKIDLHNLFHFLALRMDSHAQLEIRTYANAIYELIKPIVPLACEAFEDYRLNAKNFSAMEMTLLRTFLSEGLLETLSDMDKPYDMTKREWADFLGKLS